MKSPTHTPRPSIRDAAAKSLRRFRAVRFTDRKKATNKAACRGKVRP